MNDSLGTRLKERFEDRARYYLPRRAFAVIRIDGKCFHTFARDCARPFDQPLIEAIDLTAEALCKHIAGAVLAYTQSDEISVLLCDFLKRDTTAWLDYNVQKIASVSASIATAAFNSVYQHPADNRIDSAVFDARVFSIPDPVEVVNYFIWRQKDAERNSLNMVAQALYSHKALQGKQRADLHELLHKKGVNWNNCTAREKRGGLISKPASVWVTAGAHSFTKEPDTLRYMLPVLGYDK